MRQIHRLLTHKSGATAIEYAMICAVVVLVALVGIVTLGNSVGGQYNNVADKVLPVL
ncbi:MAG: Flp family type IVb pilin [Rickettsiales bacterium]